MNKLTISSIVLGTIAVIAILYFGMIRTENSSGQKKEMTDDHGHDHAVGAGKTVHLNKAQIENSNLAFGWFEKKNLNEIIHASGYTELPPQNEADVSVFASGIIKTIKVIEGEYVKKGQVLAVIESPESAKIQEQYQVSKANLDYLKLEHERQVILTEQDVNAKKMLQKIEAELKAEEAIYNVAKSQLKLLGLNGEGDITTVVPVRAPISGNITNVLVKIGSSVEPGNALFSLVDNSEMHVDLLVYEKDLYKVKIGQNVRFVLTNQSNKEIGGTIFNIGKSFENETKTVAVHADIEESTIDLIPGMYVNALIDVGTSKVNTLPESAVVNAEGRDFIFITDLSHNNHGHDHSDGSHHHDDTNEERLFSRIEVKRGETQLGYTQITLLEDIPEGYKIVTKSAYYLQSHLQKSEGGGGHSH